jgi:hypothetical protein
MNQKISYNYITILCKKQVKNSLIFFISDLGPFTIGALGNNAKKPMLAMYARLVHIGEYGVHGIHAAGRKPFFGFDIFLQ